jgi:shikimate kinase
MASKTPHPELLRNLVLIGGRGCGKSSVARRILRRNRNFDLFCLDTLIRYEAGGLAIPAIVERDGWRGFRELEIRVVEKVSVFQREALLDCGGGVVVELDERDREIFSERKVAAIRRHGLVVYLQRDPEYLLGRIGEDPNRPELSNTHSFLELMERRDPWYRAAADLVLDCGTQSKDELVEDVLAWFYDHQQKLSRASGRAH